MILPALCYTYEVIINNYFMNYYIQVLKKYAVFSGRARRKEYWMFVLINALVYIVLFLIDNAAGTVVGEGEDRVGIITTIYGLAVLIPGLAVSVRRLHDTDRTGWFVLLALIPFVGAIILIVLACQDSTPGDNKYGSNPKGVGSTPGSIPNTPPVPPQTPPSVAA